MMKQNKLFMYLVCFILVMLSCNKESQKLSLEQVKNNSNITTYNTQKLDSLQAINQITKQKVREVLELSLLYSGGSKNTEIDKALYRQIDEYFYKIDSVKLSSLLHKTDSLNAANVKINHFKTQKFITKKDTLNYAKFELVYFDQNNKNLGDYVGLAQYVLVPAEINFRNEFKFYFINLDFVPSKDSTSLGVIK